MNKIPIHRSESWNRKLYLIQSTDSGDLFLAYAAVVICSGSGKEHKCGYVNVDREEWFKSPMSDAMNHFGITFDGYGSNLLTVPNSILKTIPVPLRNYWVGIDYMGVKEQPSDDKVVDQLIEIFDLFLHIREDSYVKATDHSV